MKAREILVANTKNQRKYKITTDASNLGELKEAFDAEGIDYEGMSFTEGITRLELVDDASVLPETVEFKGETKNPVILLTNTKKNIASGLTGTRKEAYQIIKDKGLEDLIMSTYGHNFTQVTTAHLWETINEVVAEEEEEEMPDAEEKYIKVLGEDYFLYASRAIKNMCCTAEPRTTKLEHLSSLIYYIARCMQDLPKDIETSEDTITNEELDEMIRTLS